ncbi:MAG: DNA polymerase III subunit delta [Lachnospiraceae bacterium]|nr:DNA polymerase III subunit delta [Lachnospiraceae bacterium]
MKPRDAAASLEQLKKDLSEGNLRNCYLLFGCERYLRNFYEKKLISALGGSRDDMNTNIFDTNPVSAADVISQAQTLPFFADRRIVVVRYSGFFKKNSDELADFIGEAPDTTTFIFVEDDADARLKLYKQIAKHGLCVEFTTQSDRYLLQNIGAYLKKNNKRMSEDDARYMLDVIGNDMGRLMSELEKLISYALEKEVVTREDIDAICSRNIEDRIFEMIDSIMKKDIRTCLERYEDLLALRIAPVKIIVMLQNQFLWMLQLKSMYDSGYNSRDIIENVAYKKETDPETGAVKKARGSIGEFQVKIYLEQALRMETSELQKAITLCERADESFKTGKMNERMAVEVLMAGLCT